MYYSLYYGLNNTGLPIILVDIKGKTFVSSWILEAPVV